MRFNKLRLGESLLNNGEISKEQLDQALKMQKESGKKLGEVLITGGFISEENLTKHLSKQFDIEYINIDNINVDPKIANLIPETMARLKNAIPLYLKGGFLTVAFAEPQDSSNVDDIATYTGYRISPVISEPSRIQDKLHFVYTSQNAAQAAKELKDDKVRENEALAKTIIEEGEDETEPVIRLINNMIEQAVLLKASDIHIEPLEDKINIRFRIDGHLTQYMETDILILPTIISRIKFISNMNIAEKRIPQDGRINYKSESGDIDLRISIMPTIFGEKAVIRITTNLSFDMNREALGYLPENNEKLDYLFGLSHGIILVTGPTGSGKSTTLYTALKELKKPNVNIITVENPVEMVVPGVTQVEVSDKSAMTFALALRSILRQDPDIVMVGEIRDKETAQIASSVAITGHLVLSTLHTYDAPSSIIRLLDMGVPKYMVSSGIAGVVSQRLMRTNCPYCEVDAKATDFEKEILGIPIEEEYTLRKGLGCRYCNHTGYKGRRAIAEIMIITEKIRRAISSLEDINVIANIAKEEKMITLRENAVILVKEGKSTVEELLRVTDL